MANNNTDHPALLQSRTSGQRRGGSSPLHAGVDVSGAGSGSVPVPRDRTPATAGGRPQAHPPASAPSSPYHSQYPGQLGGASTKPIRRRMRVINSCLECRRRKLKCNKDNPCQNCVKFSRECVFLSAKLDEASQLRLTEIKEKVGSLERALERDVAKPGHSRVSTLQGFIIDGIEHETFEELDPWPSDIVCGDVTYDDDTAEGLASLLDTGVQIGRMRMTDRLGGLSRPRLSEEMIEAINRVRGPDVQTAEARLAAMSTDGSAPRFVPPVPPYIQPPSEFIFGQSSLPPTPLEMLLPTNRVSDGLIEQYFRAVHPVARCVHRPSFEVDYRVFCDELSSNVKPRPSTQAVMFAAMFTAAVSMDDKTTLQRFGLERQALVNNLKAGVESALCQASYLRTTRLETLQALIMYLIPLAMADISRTVTVMIGAAVRLAECNALHRDGEAFGLSPTQTHVRRLLWHQLCILDLRAAEAHGPRPSIRRDDFDARLPVNCDEEAIRSDGAALESEDHWTPTILSLIRFEINQLMRAIWADRIKLERRQMLLTEVLSKTEDFRKRIIQKYEGMLRDEDPLQRYAKLVMHMLIYKVYSMVLHPYHHNSNIELPHRLNDVLIMSGIMLIEIGLQLENDATFKDWTWYFGSYTQYQVALLLAVEIHVRPMSRDAARIWACLDYVFNLDRNLTPDAKLIYIFQEVWTRAAVYNKVGKLQSRSTARSGADGGGEHFGSGPEARPGGVVPDHQSQSEDLYSYYPPLDVSVLHPGLPEPPMMAGQYVGGGSDSPVNPSLQPGAQQGGRAGDWAEAIDWDAINDIFPADPTTGEVNFGAYHDPSISINWQQWR
ncbi:related to binuclear zinc cluster transcription factor that regulates the ratio between aurofusarin and rubrofusarin biosynthesis [Cephalotrichum gorgonifer]|uniref:Related to binuclear zinc cluster transcription factor that regulates the ratio between aurofusarin and rubrofusarin biosynthesis n=1 Tax=Cephalotrichum gorgonifer TaxID=2041049 RepID=A0AAE8MXG1_9PEZI|nr:related to binuclear zinc cluster transcription factor that regulates the ratio between aurofusarin and rubrofusarin biosynthesis [Cephalotrichum gorgonifer]